MSMIEIRGLSKSFGDAEVLHDINMTLVSGRIYGLTGRNGSGKTMLLKHILGFVRPTSGTVKINGKTIGQETDIPESVGAIIENPGFLSEYSGYKNLKLLAGINGKAGDRDIREAIHLVGLEQAMNQKTGKYSLGMRQRLGIAQALMENPDILLLDEPLSGLDNDGVREMYRVFHQQKDHGKLIVIASHSKEDISNLCDEIFQFDKGRIVAHETHNTIGREGNTEV